MFLQLIRIYFDTSWHNSVQYYHAADYASVDAMRLAADARYHNVLAADLQNGAVTYNACYLIDNAGNMLVRDVFDRRIDTTTTTTEE